MEDSEVNYYPLPPIPYPLFHLSPFYFCLIYVIASTRPAPLTARSPASARAHEVEKR